MDKAATIACEDLSAPIPSRRGGHPPYGTEQNRRLAGWVKGMMAQALALVSQRRGAALALVNCAYTSQMDSRYGVLLGSRNGEAFYCFDGEALDADTNAARNILARMNDDEIPLFMPFSEVKVILSERTEHFKRVGLLTQDSSCTPPVGTSTESELPLNNSAEV